MEKLSSLKMVLGAKKLGTAVLENFLVMTEGEVEDWSVSYTQGRQAGETVGGVLHAWSEHHPALCLFSFEEKFDQSVTDSSSS